MAQFCEEIPVSQLREGMAIATKFDEKSRRVIKQERIREIDGMARGCRNVHVNKNQCWDRAGFVNVVKER